MTIGESILQQIEQETLAWEDPRANRGYASIGREQVTRATNPDEISAIREQTPDYKESMEIGRDWDLDWKNRWPSESMVPGFKQRMLDFYEVCSSLQVLLQAINQRCYYRLVINFTSMLCAPLRLVSTSKSPSLMRTSTRNAITSVCYPTPQ